MSTMIRTALRGVQGRVAFRQIAVTKQVPLFTARIQQPALGCRWFSELRFAETHEWFKGDGDEGTLGISDFAQSQLGEVVYCDLPEVGAKFKAKETICTLESVKAVGEVYAPSDCQVTEVNKSLADEPKIVNSSPEVDGWLVKVKLTDKAPTLMDRAAYAKHIEAEKKDD